MALDDRLASLRLAAPGLEVRPVDEALRGRPARARLAFEGTTAVKFAYLDAPERRGLPLRLYPADTLEQARVDDVTNRPRGCERRRSCSAGSSSSTLAEANSWTCYPR